MEMVHELEERGCTPVKAVDELTDDTTLVIRSHGVEKSVIDSLVKEELTLRTQRVLLLKNPQDCIKHKP